MNLNPVPPRWHTVLISRPIGWTVILTDKPATWTLRDIDTGHARRWWRPTLALARRKAARVYGLALAEWIRS